MRRAPRRGLIGRIGRHPETQIVLDFETRAHTKTHYHRYQLRTGTNRQCHGRMQSELWRVPLGPTTLSLSSRDVCAALPAPAPVPASEWACYKQNNRSTLTLSHGLASWSCSVNDGQKFRASDSGLSPFVAAALRWRGWGVAAPKGPV